MRVKRTLITLAVAALAFLVVESFSAYVMFRYYAATKKSIRPIGSSTLFIARRLVDKVRGPSKTVEEAIDHGPLFEKNAELGFSPRPGSYRVTETFDNLKHIFDISIDTLGHRVSSYRPAKVGARLVVTGDSALFGWGLDDEETLPWLLQARLPSYRVINLTMTSYSSIQALLQLQRLDPPLAADDLLLLEYQQRTNDFNVGDPELLVPLQWGYEAQLGDAGAMRSMDIPYGFLDAGGKLAIRRMNMSCVGAGKASNCPAIPRQDLEAARRVTIAAFDQILALARGRVVCAFVKGADDDPVIRYLRSRGVAIADVRTVDGYPDEDDVVAADSHPGPFWQHQVYAKLLRALLENHLVE